MFHKDIFCKFPTVNISKLFNNYLIIIINMQELNLENFKGDFLNISIFFCSPSDSRFSNSCISAKYCPFHNKPYIHRKLIYLPFRSKKNDPDDWFYGTESHLV